MRRKKEISKKWQVAAAATLVLAVVACIIAGVATPYYVKATLSQRCGVGLQQTAALLDPLLQDGNQLTVPAQAAADVGDILKSQKCPLAQGGVVTVMRGETPLFSVRDRQLIPFASPVTKQYVYSYRSLDSGLHYVFTVSRQMLDGEIHKVRLLLVSVILLLGVSGAGGCLWLGGKVKEDKGEKSA